MILEFAGWRAEISRSVLDELWEAEFYGNNSWNWGMDHRFNSMTLSLIDWNDDGFSDLERLDETALPAGMHSNPYRPHISVDVDIYDRADRRDWHPQMCREIVSELDSPVPAPNPSFSRPGFLPWFEDRDNKREYRRYRRIRGVQKIIDKRVKRRASLQLKAIAKWQPTK